MLEFQLILLLVFPVNQIKNLKNFEVMKEVKFDSAYNFIYSPRNGTKAAEYDDAVSENTRKSAYKM